MRWSVLLLASITVAAWTPLLARQSSAPAAVQLPAWPHEFEGRPLTSVAMPEEERRLLAGFPGAVQRFTDGERDIVLRWVTQPTRRLHPAEDCHRALGYEVSASGLRRDRDGTEWRCFTATRGGASRQVCEHLRDADGMQFTDVSSWYWAATLGRTAGPWLVTSVSR